MELEFSFTFDIFEIKDQTLGIYSMAMEKSDMKFSLFWSVYMLTPRIPYADRIKLRRNVVLKYSAGQVLRFERSTIQNSS